MIYYKYLNADGSSCNGGSGTWNLPKGTEPGAWMPKVKVNPCHSGYHLCEENDLLEWSGPSLWIAEGKGESERAGDKTVFPQARLIERLAWDDRIARHFSCDCAERVLKFIEMENPKEKRPHEAIRISRLYADGLADDAARAAARDAARTAAWAAARADAWAAARAAAWAAARTAARDAARAAAWDDARAAAWDDARADERKWQIKRLLAYATGKIKLKTLS